MKYTWELNDIKAGVIACRRESAESIPNRAADGWDAKWTYQIGWLAAGPSHLDSDVKPNKRDIKRDLFSIISVADGMVLKPKTRAEVVEILNRDKMVPATAEVIASVFELVRKCHNPN